MLSRSTAYLPPATKIPFIERQLAYYSTGSVIVAEDDLWSYMLPWGGSAPLQCPWCIQYPIHVIWDFQRHDILTLTGQVAAHRSPPKIYAHSTVHCWDYYCLKVNNDMAGTSHPTGMHDFRVWAAYVLCLLGSCRQIPCTYLNNYYIMLVTGHTYAGCLESAEYHLWWYWCHNVYAGTPFSVASTNIVPSHLNRSHTKL